MRGHMGRMWGHSKANWYLAIIYMQSNKIHEVFLWLSFIHHMSARHVSDFTGPSSGAFVYKLYVQIWYKLLVGKPEGKRPLGRSRRRWEDNIKMDLQEVGRGCGDWMELAQDRDRWRTLVSTVMNLGFHKMRRISWLASKPVSFSRRTLLHGVSKYLFTMYLWLFLKTLCLKYIA